MCQPFGNEGIGDQLSKMVEDYRDDRQGILAEISVEENERDGQRFLAAAEGDCDAPLAVDAQSPAAPPAGRQRDEMNGKAHDRCDDKRGQPEHRLTFSELDAHFDGSLQHDGKGQQTCRRYRW